jgi:plastocyanin
VVAGVALMAAGAGTGLIGASAGAASTTGQTVTVNVDGTNSAANESFLAYYPNVVKVHPGDTVVFHWMGPGEPHTVTLGTLADAAVKAFENLPMDSQAPPPQSAMDADAKLPQLLPEGPGDAVQSAANPCFLTTETPPATGACPSTAAQPDFTGTETYYNSGWLDAGAGDNFTVHLSDSIAPGTYRYLCLLHREHMSGQVVVVPNDTAVPSAEEQAATGRAQLQAEEAKLASTVDDLRHGMHHGLKLPGEHAVVAGSSSPDAMAGSVDEFGPNVVSIPVGGTVTWTFDGPHTVTFGATDATREPRKTAPDGTIHLNGDALAPAGGPGAPSGPPPGSASPPPGSASPPPGGASPPPVQVVASTYDGTGFHNSGIFFGDPSSGVQAYSVTFTKPGKYHYICTIHDHMEGDVIVGAAAAGGGGSGSGQVSEVPAGGAATGGGASSASSATGLVGLGLAVMVGGAAVIAVPVTRRQRRGPRVL